MMMGAMRKARSHCDDATCASDAENTAVVVTIMSREKIATRSGATNTVLPGSAALAGSGRVNKPRPVTRPNGVSLCVGKPATMSTPVPMRMIAYGEESLTPGYRRVVAGQIGRAHV